MPILTTCPSCGRALRVPDNLIGANVRCPGCETIFRASEGSPEQPKPSVLPPISPLDETVTHIPSEAVREQPASSETHPPAQQPPAEGGIRAPAARGIREDAAARPIPLPPPPEFDEDEDEDEEELDRLEEIHRRRRFGAIREEARGRVNAPSIGLIVTGVLSILYGLGNVGLQAAVYSGAFGAPPPGGPDVANLIGGLIGLALQFTLGGLTIYGATKMRKLQSYGLALTACILAIIPCQAGSCCIVGIVFGIWGIVVLNDPDVKACFMAGPPKREERDRHDEDSGISAESRGEEI